MLAKYDHMWAGQLGKFNTVHHRIDLVEDARPVTQRPYRTGPKAREFIGDEVKRMLEAEVIEPAQSEWASSVVCAPRPDGSLRL